MEWIKISDQLPTRDQELLIYKNIPMGGYYEGIYIATYIFFEEKRWLLIIKDAYLNRNNYRPIKEFSHWMLLPEQPKK